MTKQLHKWLSDHFKNLLIFSLFVSVLFSHLAPVSALTNANIKPQHSLFEIVQDKIFELEGIHVTQSYSKDLNDPLLDQDYTLFVFHEGGYAIVADQSGVISEYCLDTADIPYENWKSGELLYGGPDCYMRRINQRIETAYDGEIETLELTPEYISAANEITNVVAQNHKINQMRSTTLTWTGITSSRFTRYNSGMWINNSTNYPSGNGICGPISLAIMMAYYQDYCCSNYTYVPTSIRTKNSTSPGTLITKLNAVIGHEDEGTIISQLRGGYVSFYSIYAQTTTHASCSMLAVGSPWSYVKIKCDGSRPSVVRLLTSLGSTYSSNHYVTVYAYSTDSSGTKYYRCIDNHGHYAKQVNASWAYGALWIND